MWKVIKKTFSFILKSFLWGTVACGSGLIVFMCYKFFGGSAIAAAVGAVALAMYFYKSVKSENNVIDNSFEARKDAVESNSESLY